MSSRTFRITAALALMCGAGAASAAAQGRSAPPAAGGQPGRTAQSVAVKRMSGARTTEPPTIDGVLDDRAWDAATPVNDFVQAEPTEGSPATERTDVRLLFDDNAIYIGVMCYDSEPSQIVTTDSRRDSSLNDMDSFQIIFDTYLDRQNGFIFGTNALGMEYDAQVRNEGETQSSGPPSLGRTSGGSGGGLNVNWDGAWTVKSQISDKGWSAEFRIPLRTLRYGPPPQTWGVNFARNIRRKREQVYWSPISRVYNITRLSSAGEVRELQLRTPMNLKVMPYAISSSNRNFTPGAKLDNDGNWGVDAKVGVTSSLNLDLTYNTDFAQVEVDEQQINLTRFNLLFPEKRPFFLENRGLFAVGRNGEVDLFFSRRIGINDSGALIPIRGGARLTGKTNGLNVGIIDMQTDSAGDPLRPASFTPANNFFAGRVSKDLPSRSSVGAIFVNRSSTGSGPRIDSWNRTWGADAKWGASESLTFSGFAAKTETPGLSDHDYAYNGGTEFRNRVTRAYFDYTEVGEDFNPEVGFLERTDAYRQISTGFYKNLRRQWLTDLKLREWRPHTTYESYWGFDGFQETALLHIDNALDFESGNFISPGFNLQHEGLRAPFEVYPGVVVPAGSYDSPYFFLQSNTDRKRLVSGGLAWNYGGFLSGHQNAMAPTLTVRTADGRITSTLRWTVNDIALPQGDFVTNLGSLRVTYNFTPRINLQGLVQYNDLTNRWSTNLRFNLQQTAATGLYVVYNDTEAFNGIGPVNRAFIIKYSHMIDVLH